MQASSVPRAVSTFLGATVLAVFIIAAVHFGGDESSQATPAQQTSLEYTAPPPVTTLEELSECGVLAHGATYIGTGFDPVSLTSKGQVLECAKGSSLNEDKDWGNYPKWMRLSERDSGVHKESEATVMSSKFDFAENSGYELAGSVEATPTTEEVKGTMGGELKMSSGSSSGSNSGSSTQTAKLSVAVLKYSLTAKSPYFVNKQNALAPAFVQQMQAAVASDDADDFAALFDTYGTHVVTKAYMGGVATSETSEVSSNGGASAKQNLAVSLGLSFPGGESLSGGYKGDSSSSSANNYKNTRGELSCSGGADENCKADFEGWVKSVKTKPVPIRGITVDLQGRQTTLETGLTPIWKFIPDRAAKNAVKSHMQNHLKNLWQKCPNPAQIKSSYSNCAMYPGVCDWKRQFACNNGYSNDGSMGYDCCCARPNADNSNPAFDLPLPSMTLKAPTSGSSAPCGGSASGICDPYRGTCSCKGPQNGEPGLTGKACQMYQVGIGSPDPTAGNSGAVRGGVKIVNKPRGQQAYYKVCDGTSPASDQAGITYSLDQGPQAYALKTSDGGCPDENTKIDLPAGVCIQTFYLWGDDWGGYNYANGWEPNKISCDYTGDSCRVQQRICGGKSGKKNYSMQGFCAYRLQIQEGFQC